jgi:hypothetical protein
MCTVAGMQDFIVSRVYVVCQTKGRVTPDHRYKIYLSGTYRLSSRKKVMHSSHRVSTFLRNTANVLKERREGGGCKDVSRVGQKSLK